MLPLTAKVEYYTKHYMDMVEGKLPPSNNIYKSNRLSGHSSQRKLLGQNGAGGSNNSVNLITPSMQSVKQAHAVLKRRMNEINDINTSKPKKVRHSRNRTGSGKKSKRLK